MTIGLGCMHSQENFEILTTELSFPMFSATDFLKNLL